MGCTPHFLSRHPPSPSSKLSSTQQPACTFRSIPLTRSSLCNLYWLQVASSWDKDQNTDVGTMTCMVCLQPISLQAATQPLLQVFRWTLLSPPPVPMQAVCSALELLPPLTPLTGHSPTRSVFPAEHLPYSVNHPVTAFNIATALYLFI